MEPVNTVLVGCGMMGARHVRGMAELGRTLPGTLRLAAVCDLNEDYAQKVAQEAEDLMGLRPQVFDSLEQALASDLGIEAADLVTDPRSHDGLAVALMEAGVHVLCEKPFGLTIPRCQRMVDAAQRTGQVLATAENNRRDPMNRLGRACMDAGLIGRPNFALQVRLNPGSRIIGTAWRHRLAMGGVLLDVALHTGYIIENLMGPIKRVSAEAQTVERARAGKEALGREVAVTVDSEDVFSAVLEFENGAQGQWTAHYASFGEAMFKRLIMGDEGTLNMPSDRSGSPVQARRGSETLEGDALLDALPDYRLNDAETKLFGDRPGAYSLKSPETDRKLLAAEMHDFADAIRTGRSPETDGLTGMRSVAIIYAIMESAQAGRPVTMDEILSGKLHDYQDRVEAASME